MSRPGLQLIVAVCISMSLIGCVSAFGHAQPFAVKGVGSGTTMGEATRAAWRDAAEKIRLQGYDRFHMNDTSTVTRGSDDKVEVEMQFEVTPRD